LRQRQRGNAAWAQPRPLSSRDHDIGGRVCSASRVSGAVDHRRPFRSSALGPSSLCETQRASYGRDRSVWEADVTATTICEAEAAGLRPGRALEVSSGVGSGRGWLVQHGWTVTAVEHSRCGPDEAAEQVTGPAPIVSRYRSDVTLDPLPVGPYDLVVVHHLRMPPAERRHVLDASARALAPSGVLLVTVHHDESIDTWDGPRDPGSSHCFNQTLADLGRVRFDDGDRIELLKFSRVPCGDERSAGGRDIIVRGTRWRPPTL